MWCCDWILPQNWENGSKIGFSEILEIQVINFSLNLVYKESSNYLLYYCTNVILGKNLVLEIWAKMLSASQIAGFLNRLMYISRRKWWKSLFFCMLIQIHGNQKLIENYWDGQKWPKIGFFFILKKFVNDIVIDKNWYCSEFDLTCYDLGFTMGFWISMSEFFAIMNSFTTIERNKNEFINGSVTFKWYESYLTEIFLGPVFLNSENWTMLVVSVFLVLTLFYGSQLSKIM